MCYAVNNLTKSNFKDADDERVWRLDPSLFNYYKSAEVHTHEKRVSQRTVSTLITAFFVFAAIGYFVSKGFSSSDKLTAQNTETTVKAKKDNPATPVPLSAINQSVPTLTPHQLEKQRVAMVVSTGNTCVAKNSMGHRINLTTAECLQYSYNPKLIEPSYLPQHLPERFTQSIPATDTM